MIEQDEEGFAIVRVKDIIAFLSSLDPQTRVYLDKDGWMEDEIQPTDAQHLIKERGLFCVMHNDLFINN